jgi:hypothetical protein
MTPTWEVLKSGVEDAWDTVAQASSTATFFQTRAWAELFALTFPRWRVDPTVLEFSDGNLVVLPMLRHSWVGYRECMAPHVYGGPVFLRPPGEAHLEAAQCIPTWFSDVTLVDNPFAGYRREQDGLARWRLSTTATDLRPGFDALWKRFRDTHRRHFRSAEKQGVTVSPAGSLEEVDAYYAIYRDSLRGWGDRATGFYPRSLFRNIAKMEAFGDGIRLLLARKGGTVIGGVVVVYHGAQAVYWHGVSRRESASAHPSPFLLVSALREACEQGYRWFDFMGPNEHLKGVQHFKDGFAAQRLPYDAYYSLQSIRGILFARYRRLKERTLHRCPL